MVSMETDYYLEDVWNRLKQFNQLGEAVVSHSTLLPEVVMVGGYELIEGHSALRRVTQQVNHLDGKLLRSFAFF